MKSTLLLMTVLLTSSFALATPPVIPQEARSEEVKKALENMKKNNAPANLKRPPGMTNEKSMEMMEKFKSMTPEEKTALKKRMDEYRKMTPDQRKAARDKWNNMDPKKKEEIRKKFKDMTPDQRKKLLENTGK